MGFRGGHPIPACALLMALITATSLPAGAAADAVRSTAGNRAAAVVRVKEIKVVRGGDDIEIQINANRPITRARGRRLSEPERFVLDLMDAELTGDPRTIDVDTGDIKSIRIAPVYQPDERITRVIVDLAGPRRVEVSRAGHILKLKLASAGDVPAEPVVQGTDPGPQQTQEVPVAERRNSLAQLSSAGESGTELPSANGALEIAGNAISSQLLERREDQPAAPRPLAQMPASISDQAADSNTALIAESAVEMPPLDPTSASDPLPAGSDVQIFDAVPGGMGVGVTGRGHDQTLGVDREYIVATKKEKEKENKKKKDSDSAEAGGSGREGSLPPPFHLSGSAIGGYYQAENKNGHYFADSSAVGSLHLDASGYLFHPGFFSFDVKPQGSMGRQSSEGVFPDGQGIAATTTFLGGSGAPLTLSYSRLDRKLVTFGPLDRLAGLEADTSQDSVGLNWALRVRRLPEMTVSLSKFSDSYEPLAALAPATADAARLGAVEMREKVLGWNLQTRYKAERSSQDLINIFDPTQMPYAFQRKDQEVRASADHDFGQWLSITLLGGGTKSQNWVQDRPFDQSYRFLTGNFLIRPSKKLILAFHGGVNNNVIGATLEQTATPGASTPDQPFLLVPTSARLQMLSYSVSAQYALTKSLRLEAEGLRETTDPQQDNSIVTPASGLTSAQGGIAYSRRLRFVHVQSHYAANVGNFVYANTGASRSAGHKADLGITIGRLRTLEVTAGAQGSMQDVTGNTYMRDRNWGTSLTLSRTFREQWRVQATYNRQRDAYTLLSQQFASYGSGFTVLFLNPYFDLSASQNVRDGLSFQADPRLQYVSSSQAGMLLGAFPGTLMAPTAANWSAASATVHPKGKLRFRGSWLRSRQQLQGIVNNYYSEWEASAGYQFRSLSFDAGYIFHDQNFGVDIFQRNRLFFRVVRDFTFF